MSNFMHFQGKRLHLFFLQREALKKSVCNFILILIICLHYSSLGLLFTLLTTITFIRFNRTPIIMASGRELCYVLLLGNVLYMFHRGQSPSYGNMVVNDDVDVYDDNYDNDNDNSSGNNDGKDDNNKLNYIEIVSLFLNIINSN